MKGNDLLRTCIFDLETWDLSPVFGPILCASVLTHDGSMISFRQDEYVRRRKNRAEDMVDDRLLIQDLLALLRQHDVLCGWHVKGFDIPLLSTRAVKHGLRGIQAGEFYVIDAMWQCKGWRALKPKSASLANAAEYFQCEEQKYPVCAETWMKARAGNRDAMDIAVERCESDVRVTANVTRRIYDEGYGPKSLQRYP